MKSTPSDKVLVALPRALEPITLPAGWSRASEPNGAVTIVGPEGDLRVAFLVCALDGTPEEIARRAWQVVDPGFDFPARQTVQMPGSGGWDGGFQIVYNVPAAQSRSAIAVLRTRGDDAYCTLVLGTKASLSRRMAQIMEVLESWTPEGFSAPSLAGAEPKQWGENESAQMSEFLRAGMAELHRSRCTGGSDLVVRHRYGQVSPARIEPRKTAQREAIASRRCARGAMEAHDENHRQD
jgi:hypothetical protein